MVYDSELHKELSDCWFPEQLDAGRARMSPAEYQAMFEWINNGSRWFEEAIRNGKGIFNVTWEVPSVWTNTPLQPLYWKAAGEDSEYAALLYGNLVCRVGVQRPELWWSFKQKHRREDHHSRSYVMHE